MTGAGRCVVRALLWALAAAVLLQIYFVARIAIMRWVAPESSAFERSQMLYVVLHSQRPAWSQQWVAYAQISDALKRAVIASEDANYIHHHGVEWDALVRARARNAAALARARTQQEQAQQRLDRVRSRAQARLKRLEQQGKAADERLRESAQAAEQAPLPAARVVGGSTITQQLAKNLLLSVERNMARKAQELLLVQYLEFFLGKRRILEIYLNHAEWGQGIFGAQAAARYYFGVDAAQLTPAQAAQLAVMLPRPRYFEQRRNSAWLAARARTVQARMVAVQAP